jgi:bifunctional enzyme CysN/CysC
MSFTPADLSTPHPTSHLADAPSAAAPPTSDGYAAAVRALQAQENKSLLRFVTIGSVDDGKSTLIGRLLYDTNSVYQDQLAAIQKASAGGVLDLSLLTDGLEAERQQGITIDVAYRYFSTPTRKFIIADTPGHIQYTRNMATGASTADLAIILIDARYGVLAQSRRHAKIASLLGIKHLVVAVNKMDLVAFSQQTFEAIRDAFTPFAQPLFDRVAFFPLCASLGDNVVSPSPNTPWWTGGDLLAHLEAAPTPQPLATDRFIMPVQTVLRPDLHFRGFAGTVASGRVRPGDEVEVLPSGKRTRVKSIVALAADPHLQEAFAPMAITLTLTDEIDITRGDVLAHPGHSLHISKLIAATIVWMDDAPSSADKTYLFKHTNSVVKGQLVQLHHRLDLERLTEDPDPPHLGLNDIGRATIRLDRPLIMTPYRENRSLGAFIIIDRLTNATVAAGIIEADAADASLTPRHLADTLTTSSRAQRFRQHPTLLLLQGPDASEVARSLERALTERDHLPFVLDADALPPTGTLADTLPPTAALLCDRVGLLTLCPIALPPSLTPQTLQASLPRSRVITAHLAAAPSHTDSPSDWYLSACHPDAACAQILDRMRQHHLLR